MFCNHQNSKNRVIITLGQHLDVPTFCCAKSVNSWDVISWLPMVISD